MIKAKNGATLIAAIMLAISATQTFAATNDFQQGVGLYNGGNYGQALPLLEKAARQYPNNASCHYYLGLCYQAQKQSTMAKAQFQWVAAYSPDPTLKSYATKALGATSQAHSAGSGGSSSSSPIVAQASPAAQAGASSTIPAKPHGRCKVYMFETSWCHFCHEFAPHFDDVANKNRGKMDFQHIDAEDPSNLGLKEKFKVHSYPHLVYLDGSGNELANEGSNMFDRRVAELTSSP